MQNKPERRPLGEILRATINAAAEATAAGDLARATATSAAQAADFALVRSFFEAAKQHIVSEIEGGKTKIQILLGRESTVSYDNQKVESLLRNGNYSDALEGLIEKPKHPFHGTWTEFKTWASDEGLAVKFKYEWDGGGVHSWHQLVAEPAPAPALTPARRVRP